MIDNNEFELHYRICKDDDDQEHALRIVMVKRMET